MLFGACNPYTNIPLLKENGYDYIEIAFVTLVGMSDDEFKDCFKTVEKHEFFVQSFNGFFPGDMNLVGENVDFKVIRDHARRGFARAFELGGKVAVVGSGKARNIPEGFNRKTAEEQFAETLKICGEEAGNVGMEIVIEPLQSIETNLINTVEEGLEFAKRVNHEKVSCLVDFFHVFKSGESLDAIENSCGNIRHVHLARANQDRRIPDINDIDACKPWAAALKKCGYDLRISLEGAFYPDVETAIKGVKPILDLFR
ncbi:MAG: sugar phosphate isomerase/epimerase [Ruminococcaceae bacterium]|nr:sugar phosphate isomerase/epimerase [Oscillospiraceae bacterium]